MIVATNQANFPIMALVHEIDGDYIIAQMGFAHVRHSNYVGNAKPRKYKLYFNEKRDSYYWNWCGTRYFLDETHRTL